jgi:hypothetical protein
MRLDRYTARALVDANLMSLREYIDKFGSPAEKDAGQADGLQVSRARSPASLTTNQRVAPRYGFLRQAAEPGLTRFQCH